MERLLHLMQLHQSRRRNEQPIFDTRQQQVAFSTSLHSSTPNTTPTPSRYQSNSGHREVRYETNELRRTALARDGRASEREEEAKTEKKMLQSAYINARKKVLLKNSGEGGMGEHSVLLGPWTSTGEPRNREILNAERELVVIRKPIALPSQSEVRTGQKHSLAELKYRKAKLLQDILIRSTSHKGRGGEESNNNKGIGGKRRGPQELVVKSSSRSISPVPTPILPPPPSHILENFQHQAHVGEEEIQLFPEAEGV